MRYEGEHMDLSTRVLLNNDVEIPWIGLGTYLVENGQTVETAVRTALEIGYRHIDTASFYQNETGIGRALANSGIPDDELFVTTKVWNTEQGYQETMKAFDRSRKKLQRDVLDLYLIHWPVRDKYIETWKAMEKLYGQGKIKAIGVSNFLEPHLTVLLKNSEVVPAVNQVEWHPFIFQQKLLDFCGKHSIQLEAWSPLARGMFFDNHVLTEIARQHSRSPAQILIRWDLQHSVICIPKSTHLTYIKENSEVFDFCLSSQEMTAIDGLYTDTRLGPHPDSMG